MEKVVVGICCFLAFSFMSSAQSLYSFEGLGSLEHQGMPNNMRMGEIGIGTPSLWHVNSQNPANLVYNSFSTIQVGVEVERRNFTGEDLSGDDTGGGFRFLGYAFPIIPTKWSSSFGILPYSSVSYNTFSEGIVDGTEDLANIVNQTFDERGSGGLTSLYWANGFVIKKRLFVGFRANFTFGAIEKEAIVVIEEMITDTTSILIGDLIQSSIQESYSDINFQLGLGYRFNLAEDRFINTGFIYSPKSSLNGTEELSLIRLSNSGGEEENQEVSSTDIRQDLPQTFGYGMSYQKLNSYTVGFDVELHQWSNAANSGSDFNDLFKIAIGLEWIPDFDNVNSYFSRARYSIGFNRTRLPYIVNGQALTDFGINFGASLPVSSLSSLDLGFKFGQLGEVSNGLVRENYFEIVLGATINDRWFIKRRYD